MDAMAKPSKPEKLKGLKVAIEREEKLNVRHNCPDDVNRHIA
jgi:hypothetical protein